MSPERVQEARSFAVKAHGNQLYGSRPYAEHLDAVAELLVPWGEEAQILGYLHDVLEDTPVQAAAIRSHFGPRIAKCLEVLTDEPGENRKERKAATHAKLETIPKRLEIALVVKVADRLANLRESIGSNQKLFKMYRDEHEAFRKAVYRPGLCEELWSEVTRILGAEPEP